MENESVSQDEIKQENDKSNLDDQFAEKNEQITKLEQKVSEYEDMLRRKQAEFENYRKRTIRERDDFQKSANQKFIAELLPIVDNFEKAIESSTGNSGDATLIDGIMLVEKQLKKLLEVHGVEVIESIGKEFDPNIHEALQIDKSNQDYEIDTVINEWQKGYMLNDKVIRHSRVVVAKGTEGQAKAEPVELPEDISQEDFESGILDKISDKDKKLMSELYQLDNNRYILNKSAIEKNEIKGHQLAKILSDLGFESQINAK